jgi:TonB family protein
MFDFVMSGNRQRRPAKRILASGLTSSLAHFIVLLLLIEYPELLRGGVYQRFRTIWQPPVNDDSQNWRTVAVLPSKMMMPSADDLKKLRSNPEKKGSEAKSTPIRLNDIQAVLSNQHTKPIVRTGVSNSSTSPPANENASPVTVSTTSGTGSSGSLTGNQNDSKGGQETTTLSPPGLEPKPVVAAMTVAPGKIPDTIVASPDITAFPAVPAKNPNTPGEGAKTIHPSDIIIDNNSKGFPMGEYTNLIVELLKEKWFIPSYLKNSQGHTTVHFFIDKNGHTMNVRILAGSGSNPLDLAALNAVLSCNILPALPKGYPGDQVGVRFVFSYNEH